jgi:hypothetical protein
LLPAAPHGSGPILRDTEVHCGDAEAATRNQRTGLRRAAWT